ncbi:MAG: hypothetical protein EAZ95_11495 [Bacteroidetes bacterium]|nr:MAG: hypothetical protein EAZ95_11495 [Bacteroidota bacterium]
MIHLTEIDGFPLEALAKDLGDLRYDALATFLQHFADKIALDADKDAERGRAKLAKHLAQTVSLLREAKTEIEGAWKICEPFTK